MSEERCGGTGFVSYWDGSAYAGEFCRGCIDCERHDEQCEAELTSHGYTPCRCAERQADHARFTPVEEGTATGSATECPSCLAERRLRAQAEQAQPALIELFCPLCDDRLHFDTVDVELRQPWYECREHPHIRVRIGALYWQDKPLPTAPSVALPETTTNEDLTRSARLDADPPPQHAAENEKA